MKNFTCPVCGFVGLDEDPLKQKYEICPCCFTEFGNDDLVLTHEQLREQWIENGMVWGNGYFAKHIPTPKNWNPISQLENAGFLDTIKIVCKNCRKEKEEHAIKGLHCPIGKKHRTYGYMQYSAVTVFEPKVIKLRKPKKPKFRL